MSSVIELSGSQPGSSQSFSSQPTLSQQAAASVHGRAPPCPEEPPPIHNGAPTVNDTATWLPGDFFERFDFPAGEPNLVARAPAAAPPSAAEPQLEAQSTPAELTYDDLDEDQKQVIDAIRRGKNVFLTGSAGV